MQKMGYEAFIHYVALDIKKYLPKEYAGYDVVLKCEWEMGEKKAKLTLEKDNTYFYRQIELTPYYDQYKSGADWDLLMKKISESLINFNVEVNKCILPHKARVGFTVGGVMCLLGVLYVLYLRCRGD